MHPSPNIWRSSVEGCAGKVRSELKKGIYQISDSRDREKAPKDGRRLKKSSEILGVNFLKRSFENLVREMFVRPPNSAPSLRL